MNPNAIIPAFDPIPLPAPVWLLKALLLFTLTLHLVAMNMLLGGAWTAVLAAIRSKGSAGANNQRLYKEMVCYLPTLVAMTVTLGVAPLLFVQVLFGHFIYSASVAIGWFWWTIIPLIICAYYALYYLKFRAASDSPAQKWIPWLAALILLWISFIFSNNFNLAQQPERFTQLLLESATGGRLSLADHTTFPRWLHIIIGALAVCGIWIMWLGRSEHRRDADYGKFKLALGYQMFAIPTMINIIVGFIFMMTLPREIMLRLMGKGLPETALWMIGMGLALGAMPILKRAVAAPQSAALPLGTAMMTVTIAAMVILRDMVRSAYQGEFFTLAMPEVKVMWGPILMFLVAFVIGLVTLRWLVMTYLKGVQRG